MTDPFGGPVLLAAPGLVAGSDPAGDMAVPGLALAGLAAGGPGLLRLLAPAPTAAFAAQDAQAAGHAEAVAAVRRHGFAPVQRPTGGRLAVYDDGALVIDLVAPHPEPRRDPQGRFLAFAELLAGALAGIGLDARVGAVPDEYCPGRFSVNLGGRVKIAGLAQRITSRGYHLGTVLMVDRAGPARAAMVEAYPHLGLPLDADTVGSVAETSGAAPGAIRAAVASALLDRLDVAGQAGSASGA
jgi:octanoyl-[GcvH]:protein N-octanoyltransferase